MKSRLISLILIVGFAITLQACASRGPGPLAWMDRPLDQSHHPLASLELVAHASSPTGVSLFIFFIDEEEVDQVDVSGERFEMAEINWTPPEDGVYMLEVQAVDTKGVQGGSATSIVYIGDVGLEPRALAETTYGSCERIEFMTLRLESPVIPKGACTRVFWEAVGPEGWPVLFDGQEVEKEGETVVCSNTTIPLKLEITTPDGSCLVWQVLMVDEDLILEEPSPSGEVQIEFVANPETIRKGDCAVLLWEVQAPEGSNVVLNGKEVGFRGEREVCPEQTTTYELLVYGVEEAQEVYQVVEVLDEEEPEATEGYLTITPVTTGTQAPSTTPSVPTPTPTYGVYTPTPTPPSADMTGPSLSNASVTPSDFVYTSGGGCSPTTFKFRVNVGDPSGVATVTLDWTGNGVRSGPVNMNYYQGKYVYDLGLFNYPGSLTNFSIQAVDTLGNVSTIYPAWNLNVEQCGGG